MILLIAGIFTAVLNLSIVWWLFSLLQTHFLDRSRFELFKLRDRLFDLAEDGQLSFDSPAYGILRSTFNGMISCLENFNGFYLLTSTFHQPDGHQQAKYVRYNEGLQNALDQCTPQTAKELTELREKMHQVALIYLIRTSPIFFGFGILVLAIGSVRNGVLRMLKSSGLVQAKLAILDEDCSLLARC